jgi:hypothetical protein
LIAFSVMLVLAKAIVGDGNVAVLANALFEIGGAAGRSGCPPRS